MMYPATTYPRQDFLVVRYVGNACHYLRIEKNVPSWVQHTGLSRATVFPTWRKAHNAAKKFNGYTSPRRLHA